MNTLMDLGQEVLKIRECIDMIEIKGKTNRDLISYAYNKCTDIIRAINEIAAEIQNGVNESAEEGDVHGEPDSGAAESD